MVKIKEPREFIVNGIVSDSITFDEKTQY